MNLADIAPGLHAVWDDNSSMETRERLVAKIDAFHHRTFPSEFERFTLSLQDQAASLKGGVSGVMYCSCCASTVFGWMTVCVTRVSGPG